jgi:hypothetical protein
MLNKLYPAKRGGEGMSRVIFNSSQQRKKQPAFHQRKNLIYLFPSSSYPVVPPVFLPPGNWEKKLSHPFAAIEVSRALRAEKDVRVNQWQILLPVLTLSIPTVLCIYGFVKYFIL